jgi:hypothetical protein
MQGAGGGLIGGKKMIGIEIIAEQDIEDLEVNGGTRHLKKGETIILIDKQLAKIKRKTHLGEKIKTYIYKYIFISESGLLIFTENEFERLMSDTVQVVYDKNQRI